METKVIWSLEAEEDFDSIINFIERQSPYYAEIWGDLLVEKIELLKKFPQMGRIVPEKEIRFIREIQVDDYRMIYSFLNGIITILAIKHYASLLRGI
jgi:toxin ParE1/3/4